MTSIKKLTINCDGGARGNPGPAGIGVYAVSDDKHLFSLSEYIGETTNNVAEYTAVIRCLEYLVANKIKSETLEFILDSELIVKQIKGEYKVKQPHLQKLHLSVRQLLQHLTFNQLASTINFTHVKRDFNQESDLLANQALDNHLSSL